MTVINVPPTHAPEDDTARALFEEARRRRRRRRLLALAVTLVVATGLQSAHGLAVGPDGSVYVIDTARDEVLRQRPDGMFTVVAGNGQRGFSGDGGPATRPR